MKLFKRKKKEEQKMEDPIRYLNQKKDHRIFMYSSRWTNRKPMDPKTKKRLKIIGVCALPVCAILLGTGLGLYSHFNNKDKDSFVNEVIIDNTKSKRRIYLISEDHYSVPLTVSIDKKGTIYEEMLDLIGLLKESSDAANLYLHGFIPDDTKVNSLQLKEETLFVDFSKEFLNYKEKDESRMMESLVATLTQFDGVNEVKLTVDGAALDVLPNFKTKCISSIRAMNPYQFSLHNIDKETLVTVFYERKYDETHKYKVPVSIYAEKGESDNITFANAIYKRLPSSKCLSTLSIYKTISESQNKKEKFSLTVNAKALVDENTVQKELYDMVMLSLDLMGKEETVSFDIEGETLAVEGIIDENSQSVGNIYYNEIEI